MLFCYLSEEDRLALIDTTVTQPCSMINISFPSGIKKTGGISSLWLLWDTANPFLWFIYNTSKVIMYFNTRDIVSIKGLWVS